jgi:hypothetical protein
MESRGISILNRMHIDRSEKSILLRSDKFMPLNTHLFISGDNLYLTGYYETEQLMKIDFDALEPVVVDLLPLN